MRSSYIFTGLALLLCSCTSGGSDRGLSSLSLEQMNFAIDTDVMGKASFSFEIPDGVSAFQLVAKSESGLLRLVSLTNPEGQSIHALSSEVIRKITPYSPSPHVVNFPYLHGTSSSGVYSAVYELVDSRNGRPLSGEAVDLSVLSKSDGDLRNGTLMVNIVLVGPVANSADTLDAVDEMLGTWRIVFGRAGILIDDNLYSFEGPGVLPDPRSADPFYDSIVRATRPGAINIVLGADARGLGGREEHFGMVGVMPGPVIQDAKGVAVLSVMEVTGRDGKFDFGEEGGTQVHNDEKRLLQEEVAQLAAHYMGLEHIVDFRGEIAVSSDSLSDTASCITVIGCRSEKDARDNFMFPFPLREPRFFRRFFPREIVTDQQRQVLNNTVFID